MQHRIPTYCSDCSQSLRQGRTPFLALVFLITVGGCDVPSGKALIDLDDDDWAALCDVPVETFTCDEDGTSFMVECTRASGLQPDCTATVSDWRACDRATRMALREDSCVWPETQPECSFWATCFVEPP